MPYRWRTNGFGDAQLPAGYTVPDPATNAPAALVYSCPGSPGCPGYVEPGSAAYTQSLADELAAISAGQGTDATSPAYQSPGALNWFQANQQTILIGSAIVVGIVILGGLGGRRR